jgi:steroid 5-alpha reductase family enzyme
MTGFELYASALVPMAGLVLLGWFISLARNNVDVVDSLWSLMFLVAAGAYFHGGPLQTQRGHLMVWLVLVWALRLSIYLTARNWGHEEDRRYQAIRARNEPNFRTKALWRVFGIQALLAWVISIPLFGAVGSNAPLGWLDYAGIALWAIGFIFEAGGDWQLSRFLKNPENRGQVMNRGLWRYTRHPNYFGDFCIWWGFYLLALGAGAWWTFYGPLLMTGLLLKVSGVALLEKDIGERRPGYADYIRRTNAFFPGPPKN